MATHNKLVGSKEVVVGSSVVLIVGVLVVNVDDLNIIKSCLQSSASSGTTRFPALFIPAPVLAPLATNGEQNSITTCYET